jgi:anthranilate phosphoribosyltransferase
VTSDPAAASDPAVPDTLGRADRSWPDLTSRLLRREDIDAADVLEALGVAVDLPPSAIGECLAEAGIAFCFAPVFHPGMRHAGVARRELGVATVFNVLGPLANPAHPAAQVVGCADLRLAPVMAEALLGRGTRAR